MVFHVSDIFSELFLITLLLPLLNDLRGKPACYFYLILVWCKVISANHLHILEHFSIVLSEQGQNNDSQYLNLSNVSECEFHVVIVRLFDVLIQLLPGPSPGKPRVESNGNVDETKA